MGLKSILHKLTSTQNNITVDNYDEAIVAISTAVREAVTSEQEQTADNLAVVAAVFMKSAAFINDRTSIERMVGLLFVCAAFVYTPGTDELTSGFSPSLRLCRTWWP